MAILQRIGGFFSKNGSEISAFDPASDRLFVVAGNTIEVLNLTNPTNPSLLGTLEPGFTPPVGFTAIPNSVAVKNGIVAVAYAVTSATEEQRPGQVSLYNTTGTLLRSVQVGALPDMLTFTPDGKKILTADEGQPNQAYTIDPEGSVSIIDLTNGVASATVATAGFTSFNNQITDLRAKGIRITGPNATVAKDLEPEYITLSADGKTAYVTLQENNALAIVDVNSATISKLVPLGLKDFSRGPNRLDPSDRDNAINIRNWPVFGMYQPDAIASFTASGKTYLVTANEGDARDYQGFSEEIRVGSSNYKLDPTRFLNAIDLKQNANLGRLTVTNASGDLDGDGDFDQIEMFGSRSFSIWDTEGNLVFDSGDQLEQITADRVPAQFNSDGTPTTFDTRSDNKGPEPEGVVIGVVEGRTFIFISLERTGDIVVYEVSDPKNPVFLQYLDAPEDIAPEGLIFISATDSPTGKPLLITSNEISKTTAIFEFTAPRSIDGTLGSDTLFGTTANEIIRGLAGNDNLFGNGGEDVIFAGAGNDALYGSSRNDELDGGDGDDRLFGNGGNDQLIGGLGNDKIFGGAGNDLINGGAGSDEIYGNGGDDIIFGGIGDDVIYTGSGNDTINAGTGNDTIWLNGGKDLVTLRLGDGQDTINGFQLGQTVLGLSGGLKFTDLTFNPGNGLTQILAGKEVLATVRWIGATQLNNANNFTLV